MAQKRRQNREPFECKLRVFWQDSSGRENYAVATATDLSESGLSIIIPTRIETRTRVQVKADDHPGLNGTATVRFCSRKGMNYSIGLEFSFGTKLKTNKPAEPQS